MGAWSPLVKSGGAMAPTTPMVPTPMVCMYVVCTATLASPPCSVVFMQDSDSSGDSSSLERKLRDRALESLKKKRVHRDTHY